MFGIVDYWGFVASSVLLNMTPGSDTIYVLTRSAEGGRRIGVVSALGISGGVLIHSTLAALGLSVVLARSAVAFNAVKIAGAAYLCFMGIRALLSKKPLLGAAEEPVSEGGVSAWQTFRQGVLTNALNPKVALFFLALLPQFVAQDNEYGVLPFLLLGLTFCTTSTIWSTFLAFISSYANRLLQKSGKAQQIASKCAGVIYIILGLNVLRAKI